MRSHIYIHYIAYMRLSHESIVFAILNNQNSKVSFETIFLIIYLYILSGARGIPALRHLYYKTKKYHLT